MDHHIGLPEQNKTRSNDFDVHIRSCSAVVVALAFVVEILRVPQVVRVLRLEAEFFIGQIQHDLLGIRSESFLFPPTMAYQTGDG